MDIKILYENEHILAINKPAGMLVHGSGKGETDTVVDWFLEHYPQSASVGESDIETQNGQMIRRPGIVHRLDRDTSGVMLLAKTPEGHAHLKSQFQNRTIKKTYLAWVYGNLKNDAGTVDAPIGRSKTFAKWTAISKSLRGNARDAITHYQVLERREGFTLLELQIETGRTHQIRVHMQYLNYPVVADALYAGKKYRKFTQHSNSSEKDLSAGAEQNLGFVRQALHSSKLNFENMVGEPVEIIAQVPEDFPKK